MVYNEGRSSSYCFTIVMNDENDMKSLANIRANIAQLNKERAEGIKNPRETEYWKSKPKLRVKVQYRKPEHDHPDMMGRKYGLGGSVRKDQNPASADVYILHRND